MTLTWLTYFPSPARGVWHLGPVPIRAYAVCIIAGIVVALLIGDRRWQARGGERGVIYDIALWAVPFGLVGGRLYHLATDWRTYFGNGGVGLEATVRIWDGGLGIWGAVALGAVGAWIGCRRRRIPLPAFGDAIAPGIILAQAIGRIGNYFNQELYGRETTLPWGMEIFWRQDSAGVRDPHLLDGVSTGELYKIVQPTFLYELLWNVLLFVLLIYADRRFRMGHGRLFALYVAGYCVGRFGIELLRDDVATHVAGIRVNSFTSTFVFIGAVVYIILAPKGREDPEALRRIWQEDETEVQEPVLEPEKELAAVASTSGVSTAGALGDDPEAASEAEPVTQYEAVAGEAETEEAAPGDVEVDEAAEPDEVGEAEPEPVRQDADAEESQVESEDLSAEVPEVGDEDQPESVAEPAPAETDEAGVEDVESAETQAPEAEEADLSAEVPDVGDEDQPESVAEPAPAETDEAGVEDVESAETQAPEAEEADLLAEVPDVGDEDQPESVAEPAPAETDEAGVEDVESAETQAPEAEEADLLAEVPDVGDEDQPESVAEPAPAETDEAGVEDVESAETQAPEAEEADLLAEVPDVGDEDQPEAVAEPAPAETDEAGVEDVESAETQAPEAEEAVAGLDQPEDTPEEEPTEAAGDTSDEDSPDKRSRWWRRRKK